MLIKLHSFIFKVENRIDHQLKISFIPSALSSSPEGALFLATAEKGVVAAFDIALNPVQLAGAGEEDHAAIGNLLDLGTHFKAAPRTVKGGAWAPVGERTGTGMAFTTFLVRVQGGPLVTVRFTTGVLTDGLLSPLQV